MLRSALLTAALLTGSTALPGSASAQTFNGTCTNVHYEGPRLVAVCLNAYGVPNASSIDTRTCPPGSIGNSNGTLVCTASRGGYGGYGSGGYGYGRSQYDDEEDYAPPPRYRPRYGY